MYTQLDVLGAVYAKYTDKDKKRITPQLKDYQSNRAHVGMAGIKVCIRVVRFCLR